MPFRPISFRQRDVPASSRGFVSPARGAQAPWQGNTWDGSADGEVVLPTGERALSAAEVAALVPTAARFAHVDCLERLPVGMGKVGFRMPSETSDAMPEDADEPFPRCFVHVDSVNRMRARGVGAIVQVESMRSIEEGSRRGSLESFAGSSSFSTVDAASGGDEKERGVGFVEIESVKEGGEEGMPGFRRVKSFKKTRGRFGKL